MIQFATVDGALLALVFVWVSGEPRDVLIANVYAWIKRHRGMAALTRTEWAFALGAWPQPGGEG